MTDIANAELFDTAFQANPHPVYARLRAESPVCQIVLPGDAPAWLVSRYSDARQALNHPHLVKGGMVSPTGRNPLIPDEVSDAMNAHMLGVDPPHHTRLRRMVSAAFTARRVERLRPRVQEITDELLDTMADADTVDFIEAFAFPLPIQVICELLGVPMTDQKDFRHWSNTIMAGVTSGAALPAAFISMHGYIRELITHKRTKPADDLLSAMIAVREEGDKLTENELTSTVFLLLLAGHETTVNLLGNATFHLLSERDHWERLRAEPSLVPSAVEELLRYESPVETATFRVTSAPVEIGETLIPADEVVIVSLLSGNRDGKRFVDPDLLDMARTDNQHLAFGHGIHYCLGAPLARLEAHVGLSSLIARFPDARLAADPAQLCWRPGVLMRGLIELPVRIR